MRTHPRTLVWIAVLAAALAVGCGREAGQGRGDYVAQARGIVEDIDGGRHDQIRERFDNNLMKMLSEDQLAKAWEVFTDRKGKLKGIADTEVVERDPFTVVNVLVDMARQDGQVRVSFDEKGKVAGFFLLNTGVPVPER